MADRQPVRASGGIKEPDHPPVEIFTLGNLFGGNAAVLKLYYRSVHRNDVSAMWTHHHLPSIGLHGFLPAAVPP